MRKWHALLDVYDDVAESPHWRHLRVPGINLVPGDGPDSAATAKVMVVGEAPGAQENGAQRPFVGPSGRVLADLLAVIGLDRHDVFITNVVKYRPPGNRTPTGAEIIHGISTLRREWRIIRPTLTIAVGKPAQLALAQLNPPHGIVQPFGNIEGAWITSVYHPAFGLRWKKAQQWIENEWDRMSHEIKELGLRLR